MRAWRLIVSLPTAMTVIVLADASNNTSSSLGQEKPGAELVFVNGSRRFAGTAARHDEQVTFSTNKSDIAITITTSTTHDIVKRNSTQHKRSDSKPTPKKKKRPKNKNNGTNSTGEDEDDDDSGVGRGITLRISLTLSLVLLVGALQI